MAYFEVSNLADSSLLSSATIGSAYTNVTLTNGSATISGLTGLNNTYLGDYISNIAGFPIGTFVVSITNATTAVLSAPYTGVTTSTATLALYPLTGTSIDTTGYPSVVIQLGGLFVGQMYIEGSNDNTNWDKLLVLPLNDVVVTDDITSTGNYHLKTSTRYVRYNIQQILNGTPTLTIYGRSGMGPSAADNLSLALSQEQNMPLNVNLSQGIKKDSTNALVVSDAPVTVQLVAAVGQVTIIDMQGYNTIHLTTGAYAASSGFQVSNDQITFTAFQSALIGGTSFGTTIVASTTYAFNPQARYVRLVCTTAGMITYSLRNTPSSGVIAQNLIAINGIAIAPGGAQLGINVAQFGGIAPVTGGLAGSLAVGGASAAGVAPTYNYMGASSIDTAGLARRLLSDTTGRLQITGFNAISAQFANTLTTNPLTAVGAITGTNQATAALNVQDTAQFEGHSIVDLLAMILLELRIANQQRYEMVYQLNSGIQNAMDPPENFRNDPSTLFFMQ
jgi:hypothetical protein